MGMPITGLALAQWLTGVASKASCLTCYFTKSGESDEQITH
jgi:hypothetical protein